MRRQYEEEGDEKGTNYYIDNEDINNEDITIKIYTATLRQQLRSIQPHSDDAGT
jgi:hypothetical protein